MLQHRFRAGGAAPQRRSQFRPGSQARLQRGGSHRRDPVAARSAGQASAARRRMKLTGPQRQQFHNALLSAFPAEGSLARMLSFQLNQSLAAITGGRGLSEQVLDVISWAESQGRIDELVSGARTTVPGNPDLLAFAEALKRVPAAPPVAAGGASPPPPVNMTALRQAITRAF